MPRASAAAEAQAVGPPYHTPSRRQLRGCYTVIGRQRAFGLEQPLSPNYSPSGATSACFYAESRSAFLHRGASTFRRWQLRSFWCPVSTPQSATISCRGVHSWLWPDHALWLHQHVSTDLGCLRPARHCIAGLG